MDHLALPLSSDASQALALLMLAISLGSVALHRVAIGFPQRHNEDPTMKHLIAPIFLLLAMTTAPIVFAFLGGLFTLFLPSGAIDPITDPEAHMQSAAIALGAAIVATTVALSRVAALIQAMRRRPADQGRALLGVCVAYAAAAAFFAAVLFPLSYSSTTPLAATGYLEGALLVFIGSVIALGGTFPLHRWMTQQATLRTIQADAWGRHVLRHAMWPTAVGMVIQIAGLVLLAS